MKSEEKMSEYLCRNGHFVKGPICQICGGKITQTDDLDSDDLAEHKRYKSKRTVMFESPEDQGDHEEQEEN